MNIFDQLADSLRDKQIECIENEPLKLHTSFKVGGPARIFAKPNSLQQLKDALMASQELSVPTYVLGKGTNILFEDSGYEGLVLCTGALGHEIEIHGEEVTAAAGASLDKVCLAARDAGLTGLEFAYGIPGSVGGAVYMNAGAYGGEMKQVLSKALVLDENMNQLELSTPDLHLGYRTSILQEKPWIVLSVVFSLRKGDIETIREQMQEILQKRVDMQPLELPSAGSAFKRPEGAFAGALIEQCGFRGFRVGDAAISEKHCGFIVNLGNATCDEIIALADMVSEKVKNETGYDLEKEIRVILNPKNR